MPVLTGRLVIWSHVPLFHMCSLAARIFIQSPECFPPHPVLSASRFSSTSGTCSTFIQGNWNTQGISEKTLFIKNWQWVENSLAPLYLVGKFWGSFTNLHRMIKSSFAHQLLAFFPFLEWTHSLTFKCFLASDLHQLISRLAFHRAI